MPAGRGPGPRPGCVPNLKSARDTGKSDDWQAAAEHCRSVRATMIGCRPPGPRQGGPRPRRRPSGH
eukprot:747919-Hanusia_phi.AAC.4